MTLIPNYLDIDFTTLKERLKSLMAASDTFKDYNYEGANITMLIELVSYLSELTTYYNNKIANNIYPDTANLYDTVHSLAGIQGYYPQGYIAGEVILQVTVDVDITDATKPSPGDQLYIPAWYQINTGLTTEDGDSIIYSTTQSTTETVPLTATNTHTFNITLKQGEYSTITYTPDDIINHKIILPFSNFDYDLIPYTTNPSISLFVNDVEWTRSENFIAESSQIDDNENLYMLEYDKYKRYNIVFSPAFNEPDNNENINIIILETLGSDGSIASNAITSFENTNTIPVINDNEISFVESYFIRNITTDTDLSEDIISINNAQASINADDPEEIDTIKYNARNNMTSQFRNVTSTDYISHLGAHNDIIVGNAWGEKEQNPGNTLEYNKVYISLIPTTWGSSTITTQNVDWITATPTISGQVINTVQYNSTLTTNILEYLAPRRYLNSYEMFVLPELVHFAFDIGVRTKRMYNFTSVTEDIKSKLEYYFSAENRNFADEIDFKELHNYILDESNVSTDNNFAQIKGINNLIFRDIQTFAPSLSGDGTQIYEYNTNNNYPMFLETSYDLDYENKLRSIKLGPNQFPMIAIDLCVFINEG